MIRLVKAAPFFFLLVFAGFRLLGPTIDDPSDFTSKVVNVGQGKVYVRSDAVYVKHNGIFVSRSNLETPIRFFFGVEQTPEETITIDHVLLRQAQDASVAFETDKTIIDGQLERLQDKEKGPFYRMIASPIFGVDIDLEIETTHCRLDLCRHETHNSTIVFEHRPMEFGFSLIWKVMSI